MHVARYASNVKIQRRRGVMGASADCHSFVVLHKGCGGDGMLPILGSTLLWEQKEVALRR
jgi:hypothetical protein